MAESHWVRSRPRGVFEATAWGWPSLQRVPLSSSEAARSTSWRGCCSPIWKPATESQVDPGSIGAAGRRFVRASVFIGIEAIPLSPRLGDFNEDLHVFGSRCPSGSGEDSAGTRGRLPLLLLSATVRTSAFGCHRRRPAQVGNSADAGEPRPRPSRGRSDGRQPGPAMASTGNFPPALRAFASRSKIAGLHHPPLALRPSALLRVLARAARRLSDRHEGRDGRGRSGKGPPSMTDHDDIEPPHFGSLRPTTSLASYSSLATVHSTTNLIRDRCPKER